MRVRRSLLLFGITLGASACALIADLGDRTLGEATNSDSGGSVDNDGDSPSPGTDGSNTSLPSFCQGLVIYASFDPSIADRGAVSIRREGKIGEDINGRFNSAMVMNDPDAGARFYFVRDGGTLPKKQGTMAGWFKPAGPPNAQARPIMFRWVTSLPPTPVSSTGPILVMPGGDFGVIVSSSQEAGPVESPLTYPTPDVLPFLKPDAFNHFAIGWREPENDSGSEPTLYMTINGGTGERFRDGGRSYADAGDSGLELRIPYRGYTNRPWKTVPNEPQALRLGGPSAVNDLGGTVDDIAVWDRVLSFDELAALYAANKSIGEACR